MKKIAVIGAGAAGLAAAYFALYAGASVTLYEKNAQPGRKLCITGKGRCNVTNACDARDFLTHVVSGGKFLSSAIYQFPPRDTMEWLSELGVPLKVERGNRVFPTSDRASDIRDALVRAVKGAPGLILRTATVTSVARAESGQVSVRTSGGEEDFDAVILSTGGVSYPLTGSTGDGYRMAKALGHTIIDPVPSLVRIICREPCCAQAQGLSLKNVRLSLYIGEGKKPVYSDLGEMLFTEDGVSGPLVLSASAYLRSRTGDPRLMIDFKPALSEQELDERILRDFAAENNRQFKNALDDLLPAAMRPVFVALSGIDPEKRVHQITRAERAGLITLFKRFPLTVVGPGPMKEAIVTAGGIELSEVDPHTMQSRLCPGLYFAGEVLNVDALTGGYNLQIAFSTGRLAALSAAKNGDEK